MGLGGCVRDAQELFVAGFSRVRPKASSVLGAELEAMREGINFASKWGLVPCTLESDSQSAVNLLQTKDLVASEEGSVAEDISDLVHQSESSITFIK